MTLSTPYGSQAFRACAGLALALLLTLSFTTTAHAQSEACYLVADNINPGGDDMEGNPDGLGVLLGGTLAPIGRTNTQRIEAIAYDNATEVLYATDEVSGVDGLFGSLDTSTGAFSAIGAVGCGDGALGTQCFDDIDGLSFDPTSGILYGSARRPAEGDKDLLVQIDPATGAFIPDAFGPDADYVVIDTPFPVPLDDIDDIAFDADGVLYGILNEGVGGFQDRLVTIDPTTGAILSGKTINVNGVMQRDIEGLTFDADGQLLGVQGGDFRMVYIIDPATGDATLLAELTGASDFESIDCVLGDCTPTVTEDCITVTLLSTVVNIDGTTSYEFKVTSNCDRGLSFIAFELPADVEAALNPSSSVPVIIENPGGHGGSSPPYNNIKFELQVDFKDGDMGTFSFTLPEGAEYDGEIRIRTKSANNVIDLVLVLDECGPEDISGEDTSSRTDTGIPAEFEVAQAYPNPFSRATTIGIGLPEAAPVQIVVYDVQGRQVATLVDAELAAGQHLVDFEADGLAPGMYLYRVVTPLGVQGGKVMLLK